MLQLMRVAGYGYHLLCVIHGGGFSCDWVVQLGLSCSVHFCLFLQPQRGLGRCCQVYQWIHWGMWSQKISSNLRSSSCSSYTVIGVSPLWLWALHWFLVVWQVDARHHLLRLSLRFLHSRSASAFFFGRSASAFFYSLVCFYAPQSAARRCWRLYADAVLE